MPLRHASPCRVYCVSELVVKEEGEEEGPEWQLKAVDLVAYHC